MPYLHLPVQSGSDHILKRMNRSHTAESYLRVIERIRAARPDIVLSGDFIVGFPEETEAHFQETLDLVEAVKYGYAYSFKYSTRPGTPAAERALVDAAEADERLQRLQALITQHQREIQDGMIGREVSVLFEKVGRDEGQMVGKSEYLHAVHVANANAQVGDIAKVRIVDAGTNSLKGELT
jgi:tRNA-2-methylthio-N6-dimethylallyladenosine synthase